MIRTYVLVGYVQLFGNEFASMKDTDFSNFEDLSWVDVLQGCNLDTTFWICDVGKLLVTFDKNFSIIYFSPFSAWSCIRLWNCHWWSLTLNLFIIVKPALCLFLWHLGIPGFFWWNGWEEIKTYVKKSVMLPNNYSNYTNFHSLSKWGVFENAPTHLNLEDRKSVV